MWVPSADDHVEDFAKGRPLTFPRNCFYRPALMLLCLNCADVIFGRGLDSIKLKQCEGYYKCLLKLGDLRHFNTAENFDKFTNAHFEALALGKELPVVGAAVAPLPAAECPAPEAVVDDEYSAADIEPVPVGMAGEAATFGIPRIRTELCTVIFDNFSHSSGRRRALCECKHHTEGPTRCEKACFMDEWGNCPQKSAAYLVAWRRLADLFSTKEEHTFSEPSDEHVAVALADLDTDFVLH